MTQRLCYRCYTCHEPDACALPDPESIEPSGLSAPMVMADVPAYRSPLGTGWITSRSQRREDLKRGDCREADPGERPPRVPTRRQVRHSPNLRAE